MKSKFAFSSYFPVLIIALLLFGIIFYGILLSGNIIPAPSIKALPLLVIVSFIIVWLFCGELRTKMIKVAIEGDTIEVRNFGGLGKKKIYLFRDLNGFKTSRQVYGARGILEYLYLMVGNRKAIKISEVYHKNYKDLKELIESKTKNLGYENFNFIDELREIFL